MPYNKRVFVTVGTTSFDQLIDQTQSDSILNKLDALGYTEVTFQVGNGEISERAGTHPTMNVTYVKFIDDFLEEIKRADLVISHAGAGTCLEVLKCGKPLIIVINEELMDNHQLELAEQLQSDSYVYFCTCKTLGKTLDKDIKELKKYPTPSKHLFNNYLNKSMGFP